VKEIPGSPYFSVLQVTQIWVWSGYETRGKGSGDHRALPWLCQVSNQSSSQWNLIGLF